MAAHTHGSEHDHDHAEGSELSETQLRVRALETVLTEKGYIDPAALDAIIEACETRIGPHNGARVVAKAWTDAAFRKKLLEDASSAISTLGNVSRVGEHVVAVENTQKTHNMVVCTLCSCYPWDLLGLPPVWYKAAPYRSRAVKDPRGVLADFGVTLPDETEIRVWDSTAETRFLVLPLRPPGTDGWSEEQLAALVTRDSMIGTGVARNAREWRLMDGIHDMGGMDGFGRVEPESNEPVFHAAWEGRVLAMTRAMGTAAAWTIDMQRFSRERLAPETYITSSYYQRWLLATQQLLLEHGLIDADELAAGHASRPGSTLKRGPFTLENVERVMRRGSFGRAADAPARFKAGDRVLARNIHPQSHTRLPRYVRGHVGVVERVQGCHVLPDVAVTGQGEQPQWLYTVVFEGRELWGADADPTLRVSIEAFEPYLDAA